MAAGVLNLDGRVNHLEVKLSTIEAQLQQVLLVRSSNLFLLIKSSTFFHPDEDTMQAYMLYINTYNLEVMSRKLWCCNCWHAFPTDDTQSRRCRRWCKHQGPQGGAVLGAILINVTCTRVISHFIYYQKVKKIELPEQAMATVCAAPTNGNHMIT